jgi:aminobenzoyl-glutamate utilization protein B
MAPNVVPDYAKVWYFVRDASRAGVDDVYERVLNCAKGAAIMTDTTMEVNLITGVYPYLPNHAISAVVDKNLRLIGPPKFSGEDNAFAKEMQRNLGLEEKELPSDIEEFREARRPSATSTDAADVSWIVPTSGQFHVVATVPGIPWHSWAVASCSASGIGYKGMITAAKVIAASGIDLLMNTDIIEEAQKEFAEKTEGNPYKSVIPEGQKPPLPEKE